MHNQVLANRHPVHFVRIRRLDVWTFGRWEDGASADMVVDMRGGGGCVRHGPNRHEPSPRFEDEINVWILCLVVL